MVKQWFFISEIHYTITTVRVSRWSYTARIKCVNTVIVFIILAVCVTKQSNIHIHFHAGFAQWQQPHFYIIAVPVADKYFIAFYSDDFFCRHSLVHIAVACNGNNFVFRVRCFERLNVSKTIPKEYYFFLLREDNKYVKKYFGLAYTAFYGTRLFVL